MSRIYKSIEKILLLNELRFYWYYQQNMFKQIYIKEVKEVWNYFSDFNFDI